MKITFPATHREFYAQFDPWRKEKMDSDLPISGVYRLLARKSIGRLLGEDDNGVLYIGKGVILSDSNRIGKFINALNNTEQRHDGGVRFNVEKIKEKFPLEESVIEVTLTTSPESLECQLLEEYSLNYGELPPFNRKMESILK